MFCKPAYAPFTPSQDGQHLPPPYYRDCWHEISRGYFSKRVKISFSVRNKPPKKFRVPLRFNLAVLRPEGLLLVPPRYRLDQAFAHCPKFLTAALFKSDPLFNISVAARSHKPARDQRFGRPSPQPSS